jgi:hypothetical protein
VFHRQTKFTLYQNRNGIIILLLGLVNSLFILKYSVRLGNPYALLAPVYLIGFVTLLLVAQRVDFHHVRFINAQSLSVVLLGVGTMELLAIYVLPQESRVTRLPALIEWLSSLQVGKFPYHTSTEPSGFPLLFLLAYPFYLLGNLGYLVVLGTLLFGISILRNETFENQTAWLQFSAFLFLPTVYYELLVRSELFFNMSLVVALIVLSNAFLSKQKLDWRFAITAILFGLVLSTRSVVGLVYAIYVTYRFRTNIWNGIIFASMVLAVFSFTLLPFVLWNPELFFAHGPFSVQFAYLPIWVDVVFITISTLLGWNASNLNDLVYFSGLTLFALVAVAFLLRISAIGIGASVFGDGFDITYFIFCTPFLLLSLQGGESQKLTA